MPSSVREKPSWWFKVQETVIRRDGTGDLGVTVAGGADRGEFPYLEEVRPGKVHCLSGDLHPGDLILEVNGTPVFGLTLGDTLGVLRTCRDPIRLKTVTPGAALSKDLCEYLNKSFQSGSADSELQQVIRENLYLRAIPCKLNQ
uniref:PDZ domain-containing protein n=1 Tax=Latimeria chalumnae TaxID=7897 RepID=H2ZS03_LATCH